MNDLSFIFNQTLSSCPFCGQKTMFSDGQTCQCLSCGHGGNLTRIMLEHPDTVDEAFRKLDAQTDRRLFDCCEAAAAYYHKALHVKTGESALRYFHDRRLTDATIERFNLGYADGELRRHLRRRYTDAEMLAAGLIKRDDNGELRDVFIGRAMFPIRDASGRCCGFGGRVLNGDAKPKYLNSRACGCFDKSNTLFGLDFAGNAPFAILCEGFMDVISLHQAGFYMSMASLGTALTPMQVQVLRNRFRRVYLSYDEDAPGISAAIRAIPMLENAGIEVFVVPKPDGKDPDEFLRAHKPSEFKALLRNAMKPEDFAILHGEFELAAMLFLKRKEAYNYGI